MDDSSYLVRSCQAVRPSPSWKGGGVLIVMGLFLGRVTISLKSFKSSMDGMSTESSARMILGYKSTILLSPHLGSTIVDFIIS